MDKVKIYLAGSIRDGVPEDFLWRERAIAKIPSANTTIFSPLAGKSYDPETKKWWLYGDNVPTSRYIVHADYWCVDRADMLLVDLRSLADGYPSIGTVAEWGRSTARSILRLVTVAPNQKGANAMFGLHPFIAEHAAQVFTDVDQMIAFAARHVLAVTEDPRADLARRF
jgi:hypothetical protein